MPEETVIRQCAPTLAGIKTGSLFSCPYDDREELLEDIKTFNKKFASRGLRLLPLRFAEKRALLYLYRPSGLRHDLQDDLAREVLEQEGYPWDNSSKCLGRLVKKLREEPEFPHEIGLFLSYPPEDVKGFIDNHAGNYKYSGIWKVYGDVDKARSIFDQYRKCTDIYCKLWEKGSCIEQLAVAR